MEIPPQIDDTRQIFILVYIQSEPVQRSLKGIRKCVLYKQLPFIYRFILHTPFSNVENETVLYRQVPFKAGLTVFYKHINILPSICDDRKLKSVFRRMLRSKYNQRNCYLNDLRHVSPSFCPRNPTNGEKWCLVHECVIISQQQHHIAPGLPVLHTGNVIKLEF